MHLKDRGIHLCLRFSSDFFRPNRFEGLINEISKLLDEQSFDLVLPLFDSEFLVLIQDCHRVKVRCRFRLRVEVETLGEILFKKI